MKSVQDVQKHLKRHKYNLWYLYYCVDIVIADSYHNNNLTLINKIDSGCRSTEYSKA